MSPGAGPTAQHGSPRHRDGAPSRTAGLAPCLFYVGSPRCGHRSRGSCAFDPAVWVSFCCRGEEATSPKSIPGRRNDAKMPFSRRTQRKFMEPGSVGARGGSRKGAAGSPGLTVAGDWEPGQDGGRTGPDGGFVPPQRSSRAVRGPCRGQIPEFAANNELGAAADVAPAPVPPGSAPRTPPVPSRDSLFPGFVPGRPGAVALPP